MIPVVLDANIMPLKMSKGLTFEKGSSKMFLKDRKFIFSLEVVAERQSCHWMEEVSSCGLEINCTHTILRVERMRVLNTQQE